MTNKARIGYLGIVVAVFSLPLLSLFTFALQSDLYSHIVLIPFVSCYFVWLARDEVTTDGHGSRVIAFLAFTVAVIVCGLWLAGPSRSQMAPEDWLAPPTIAFVLSIIGVTALTSNIHTLRAVAFPLGFLFAMVPFPTAARMGIETFYQHTSASAAAVLFSVARTPFFHDGTFFQLPGINLEVAPECSGIRSSLALLLTSLVAGQLFLRSPAKRMILAVFVIPLGIVRNGFRIFTIGELCVHIGPGMIDSPIHHRGGPIFFALSLIPFVGFLYILIKRDQRQRQAVAIAVTPA